MFSPSSGQFDIKQLLSLSSRRCKLDMQERKLFNIGSTTLIADQPLQWAKHMNQLYCLTRPLQTINGGLVKWQWSAMGIILKIILGIVLKTGDRHRHPNFMPFWRILTCVSMYFAMAPFGLLVILACDASPYGVGMVLGHQLPDRREVLGITSPKPYLLPRATLQK